MDSFFFRELQLITVLLLIRNIVHLSKTVWVILHLQLRLVFIKLYILFPIKSMDTLTLKRHNSFQNKNNRKVTNSFPSRFLTFKLQEEV